MGENNILNQLLDEILIISLPGDEDRFKSTYNNLINVGFNKEKIKKIDGVIRDSYRVKKVYEEGRVIEKDKKHGYKLTPERIGNWLAHYDAWKRISDQKSKFTAICEDDIFPLHKNFKNLTNYQHKLNELSNLDEPMILRCCLTLFGDVKKRKKNLFSDKETNFKEKRMSNQFYIINENYANKAINNSDKIEWTSDVFINGIMANDVEYAYSILPNLFKDKTFMGSKLNSRVRRGEDTMERFDED